MILLDTHSAIWFIIDSGLGKRSQDLADDALAADQLTISAISFWEIGLLVSKRRLRPIDSAEDLRERVLGSGIIEVPLTGDIALRAVDLGGLPGDPADRFIVATAIACDAVLMTADARLLKWKHTVKRVNAEE